MRMSASGRRRGAWMVGWLAVAVLAAPVRAGDDGKRLRVPVRLRAPIKRGISEEAKKKLTAAENASAKAKAEQQQREAVTRQQAYDKALGAQRTAFEAALKRRPDYRRFEAKHKAAQAAFESAPKRTEAEKQKAAKDHLQALAALRREGTAVRLAALKESRADRSSIIAQLAKRFEQEGPIILSTQLAMVTVDPADTAPAQTHFTITPPYAEKEESTSTAWAGDKTTSITCHKRTGYVDAASSANAPVLSIEKDAGAWASGMFEDYFTVPAGFGGVRVTAKVVVNSHSVEADGGLIGEAWSHVYAQVSVRSNVRDFTYFDDRSASVSVGWCSNESKSGSTTWYPSVHIPLYGSGDELLVRVTVGTATTSWRGGTSAASIDAHVNEISIEGLPVAN